MAENSSKDMVLAPNEFMYVLDQTKGHVDVFVGPTKQSLSQTDQPVVWDEKTKQYRDAHHSEAKQIVKTAPEGWYIVLKNPAKDGKPPIGNGKQTASNLDVGKKINIPGPVSFCLWPAQMAKVLKGHQLRSNQYLLGRVYDEAAARENWKKAVVKVKSESGEGGAPKTDETDASKIAEVSDLIMGQLLVIKGIDVSFYIPPTGVEIVPDEEGNYVREAVTLERLEYCLLMDENGNRRYERGPAVVFPEPTEVFVERDEGEESTRKFRAIELNENSGVYIKVIADYEDEDTKAAYKVGDELFITGKDQMIYFPREEHAIVRYDKSEIHYGIAIPAGEARYVLDRNVGIIELVKGPKVFLPDPRSQVVVRRIIDFKLCNLLYPGNNAAFAHNAALAGVDLNTYMSAEGGLEVATAAAAIMDSNIAVNYMAPAGMDMTRGMSLGDSREARGLRARSAKGFSGASFDRKNKFTEPRSITLPTKFDGALDVGLYTGYAMMLVRKSGERRVVQGPQTVLLEYDETPEIMELSTGKPKTTDNMMKTVYLRVKANKVSDLVGAQTSDYCDVEMKLSYRMNFSGDPNKWFEVENYVKFMCDHLRSKLKGEIRKHTVEDFYANSTDIIRSVILGKSGAGTSFEENGMHVYDVEVLGFSLKNQDIEKVIVESQREVIKSSLALASERRRLASTIESEDIKRKTEETKAGTQTFLLSISSEVAKKKLEVDLQTIESQAKLEADRAKSRIEAEGSEAKVAALARDRMLKNAEAQSEADKLAQVAQIELVRVEVESVVARAAAVSPELAAALNSFGEKAMVEKLAGALAPLTLFGGGSFVEIMQKALAGTNFAKALAPAMASTNGSSTSSSARA